MNQKAGVVSTVTIETCIRLLRGQKVIVDSDLAALYGVETRALNQAVKRNPDRFPASFMFQLTKEEAETMRLSRSQIVTLKRGQNIKYLPFAFTEHGALMAANVLNSPRAVAMSVQIVETFIRMRQILVSYADLARKIAAMERRYDAQFKSVFDAIRELMTPPEPKRKPLGFHAGKG